METKVKITDLSQVEALVQSTQAFTEQLVIMNKLLEHIDKNTSAQVQFFTSKDGYIKMMEDIMEMHHDNLMKDVKHEINILYLKVTVVFAGIIGIATTILELLSK